MIFGAQVNNTRKNKNMTLQELSELSKVSVSMLSQIERDEKNPTIQIACQIAEALNTTLSALLEQREARDFVVLREKDRPTYIDEENGFTRHLLSPSFPSYGIEFVKNTIQPFSESGVFPAHKPGVKEYIYVEKGQLEVQIDDASQEALLFEGDSFYFEADVTHRFLNKTAEVCQYFLVIDSTIRQK